MSSNPSEAVKQNEAVPQTGDKLVAPLDLRKGLVAVADYQQRMIVRARVTPQGLQYKEIVATAVPTDMTIYVNPLKGTMYYNIVFLRQKPIDPNVPDISLIITATKVKEVANKLKMTTAVRNSRLLSKTLDAIMRAFVESGRAKVVFRF